MRRQRVTAIAAWLALAVVVWIAAAELAWPARAWTVFLLVLLPPLLVAQASMTEELSAVPREAIYLSSAGSLWLLAAITMLVALGSGMDAAALGLRGLAAGPLLIWTGGVLLASLLLISGLRALGLREAAFVRHIVPQSRREKTLFVGLSGTAGFCEELVFRGFLIAALVAATGSLLLAVLLSSGVFGLLHAYQRPAGALRAAALGAILAAPLIVTASLVPSMLAHAGLDLIAGLWLRAALLR